MRIILPIPRHVKVFVEREFILIFSFFVLKLNRALASTRWEKNYRRRRAQVPQQNKMEKKQLPGWDGMKSKWRRTLSEPIIFRVLRAYTKWDTAAYLCAHEMPCCIQQSSPPSAVKRQVYFSFVSFSSRRKTCGSSSYVNRSINEMWYASRLYTSQRQRPYFRKNFVLNQNK